MIKVSHLTKSYGSINAISDLNFTIGDRKIYGFLGPNGAGKSTTMNIMTGCLAATSGEVTFDGLDIVENPEEVKSKIGYLPEIPPVYPEMTPLEYLTFVGRAKGLRGSELYAQIEEAIADTQLETMKDRLIANLSKGYKQRVGIAQAMLGNPDVIILDEPTVGLDPKQIIYIRNLIRKLGRSHTVILSSHILPEIEAVCDHIMILSGGRLVADDTLENLRTYMTGDRELRLCVKTDEQQLRRLLSSVPGIAGIESVPSREIIGAIDVLIRFEKGEEAQTDPRIVIADIIAANAIAVYRMEMSESTLEDVFLNLTGSESDTKMRGGLQLREDLDEDEDDGDENENGDGEKDDDDENGGRGGSDKKAPTKLPDDYDINRGNDGGDGYTPLFR